jgi:hypothetical protein
MGSLPDQVYLDEIPKLREYPNIRTLGYVATHYADKPLQNVLAEIDMYAKWPKLANNTKMRVDGIFLDETPSTYDADEYNYLKVVSQAVRNGTTFKDRFIGMYERTFASSETLNEDVVTSNYLLTHCSAKSRPYTDFYPQLKHHLPGIVSEPY